MTFSVIRPLKIDKYKKMLYDLACRGPLSYSCFLTLEVGQALFVLYLEVVIMSSNQIKSRHWSGIIYPESAPFDWMQQFKSFGFPFVVSPLHDKDFLEDGTPKKPHWHCLFCYGAPTTFKHALGLWQSVGGATVQPVFGVKAIYEYLTHKNQPDKYQYPASQIQYFNHWRPEDYITLTSSEQTAFTLDILAVIAREGIDEYSTLIDFLSSNMAYSDLFRYTCTHTIFFTKYLDSLRHRRKRGLDADRAHGSLYKSNK